MILIKVVLLHFREKLISNDTHTHVSTYIIHSDFFGYDIYGTCSVCIQ